MKFSSNKPIMFVIVGVFILAISIYAYHATNAMDGATTAVITDIVESQEWVDYGQESTYETVYTAYVTYEVDGVKYENVEFGRCDSKTKVGDTVEIVYDTKDPSRMTSSDNKVPIITGVVSSLSIIFGIWQMIKKKIRS